LKVLILDLTHGGDKIGREYLALGHEVTLVDVYRTSHQEERRSLDREGFRVLEAAPSEMFDLAVVPVHCPDRFLGQAHFERRITHHHAVGELIKFAVPVIEVTGAGAKTTTCFVMAHMLSKLGRKVLLHTSRGDYLVSSQGTKTINDRASIAPASLIPLSRMEGYDVAVLEESLGGCGLGDVCAITTLGDNYPIAAGTRHAYDGKVQMVRLAKGTVVIPREEEAMWQQDIAPNVRSICFGENGDVDAELDEHLQLGVPLTLRLRHLEEKAVVDLPSSFLAPSYLTAFQCATAIMVGLGFDLEQVRSAFEGFTGVPGRGEVSREGNWYLVRERNPGVSARSIDWNLDVIETYYRIKDICLVIDPLDLKVCEKLDMKAILEVARSHPSVKQVYLFQRKGEEDRWKEVPHIQSAYDVWNMHKVVLWCTKEGYL
jgi:coenzyme F430 synthetase